MTIESVEILKLLQKHFPQIAEKKLQEEISTVGKVLQFQPGEVIMDYGSYIRLLPLVVEGSVKVMREDDDGHELFLYYLRPGQTCSGAFTCCMMNKQSFIRTIADDEVKLIGIPVKYVDEWMSRYQSWKNFVMLTYDQRMLEMVKTLDSIAFRKMDDRLLDYLKRKSDIAKSSLIQVTHQEIAADLNASREAVSRLLKQLEKNGTVALGRNQIKLLTKK